jgi:hypothetical protein
MNRSQGNLPRHDSCRPITLLTHAGVRKFQLQKEVLGPNTPCRTKVFDKFASDDASLHCTWS